MFLCFLQVRLFNERQKHFALTSSVAILKIGIIKQLCRDKSCQFRPPKKAKKKFLCSNFRRPNVSSVQREVGCWCFPKLTSCSREILTPAGECVQSVQSLEKRLEDQHSLSLNLCLTKFVRTIERAFVQVSHSFANWFPNTRVCTS